MNGAAALASDKRRIEELIAALEALEDPRSREQAKELLGVVLDLHGAGLNRLLEIVAEVGDAGRAIIDVLAQDERVSALMLLHGLHPRDLASRVQQAVNKMHAPLGAQGIRIELLSVEAEAVRLKLSGEWRGTRLQPQSLKGEIEEAIFTMAPEVAAIQIEGLPGPAVHELKFISGASLRQGRAGASN